MNSSFPNSGAGFMNAENRNFASVPDYRPNSRHPSVNLPGTNIV